MLATACVGVAAGGADWPSYRHDNQRSGVAVDALEFPMRLAWTHASAHEPNPAWPGPAKKDYWHHLERIEPTVVYDRAYHTIIAGDKLYYGSSSDSSVHCLDAGTGEAQWSFTTGGPVRLAPTYHDGRIYAGSDDGNVYCLDASSGRLIWRFDAAGSEKYLPGNGAIISRLPVRCGLVVEQGNLYFTAGVFPSQGVYLFAVAAQTGKQVLKQPLDHSAQGYMQATDSRLIIPSGRTGTCLYDRRTGRKLKAMSGGGCFAAVFDDVVVNGPTERGQLEISDCTSGNRLFAFRGQSLTMQGDRMYLLTGSTLQVWEKAQFIELQRKISKINKVRKNRRTPEQKADLAELHRQVNTCKQSDTPAAPSYETVLAGDYLVCGGADTVTAYDRNSGKTAWQATVDGNVYGLAVSDGNLFVTTDKGIISCFQADTADLVARTHKPNVTLPETGQNHALAKSVLQFAEGMKGYGVVLNAGSGELAYEILRQSELKVIAVEKDPAKIDQGRRLFNEAGIRSDRITLIQTGSEEVPLQKYVGNLVVDALALQTGRLPSDANEMFRLLRPAGGLVVLQLPRGAASEETVKQWHPALGDWAFTDEGDTVWCVARRPPLKGAGQWTHFYADMGNSACSGDTRSDGVLELQWFGTPGPAKMVDRHHRTVAPLYKDGRTFVSGANHLFALDAYNGTILWERDVPESMRAIALKDCGNMALADNYLYVAAGSECHALDVQTGEKAMVFTTPASSGAWGYLATDDNILLGSLAKKTASWRLQARELTTTVTHWDFAPMVCSDSLFAYDRITGKQLWTYEPQSGVIINPAIAGGDGHVYFLESCNPDTQQDTVGRIKLAELLASGANLTALDMRTGEVAWQTTYALSGFDHIIHLSYAKDTLLLAGSANLEVDGNRRMLYTFKGFNAGDGALLWERTSAEDAKIGGSHGEQDQHPAIVGNKIHIMQGVYDLRTGEPERQLKMKWRAGGHGCGTISTSATTMYYRGGNPFRMNLTTGKAERMLKATRPGCWINIIPAGGLILIPEGSSGCTCQFSLQASMALIPAGD